MDWSAVIVPVLAAGVGLGAGAWLGVLLAVKLLDRLDLCVSNRPPEPTAEPEVAPAPGERRGAPENYGGDKPVKMLVGPCMKCGTMHAGLSPLRVAPGPLPGTAVIPPGTPILCPSCYVRANSQDRQPDATADAAQMSEDDANTEGLMFGPHREFRRPMTTDEINEIANGIGSVGTGLAGPGDVGFTPELRTTPVPDVNPSAPVPDPGAPADPVCTGCNRSNVPLQASMRDGKPTGAAYCQQCIADIIGQPNTGPQSPRSDKPPRRGTRRGE